MKLLRTDGETPILLTFNDERKLPKYAILSHTWVEGEEISMQDLGDQGNARKKNGWKKLEFARTQARHDRLRYVWIDTCCIDKTSSAELAEAINSMYRWYAGAQICYVYLADMPDPPSSTSVDDWNTFRNCRWFTRGWTLQEMLAPYDVRFFTSSWTGLGSLRSLKHIVADVSGVHIEALEGSRPVSSFSIAQRMCWASKRQTTRIEDESYSLLGIFDVSMPVIYGEGQNAFMRLQEELLRVYADHTIFAWAAKTFHRDGSHGRSRDSDLLATSARRFWRCRDMAQVERNGPHQAYELTTRTIRFKLHIWKTKKGVFAALKCRRERRAKLACLRLEPMDGQALYRVGGDTRITRVQFFDVHYVSTRCEESSVEIVRRVEVTSQNLRLPHRTRTSETIMCRLKPTSPTGLKLGINWYHLRGSALSSAVSWGLYTTCFYHHQEQHIRSSSEDGVVRQMQSVDLHQPMLDLDPVTVTESLLGDKHVGRWCGQLEVCNGSEILARLKVPEDYSLLRTGLTFEHAPHRSTLSALFSKIFPRSATLYQGKVFSATFGDRTLVFEKVAVLEIEIGGLALAARLVWRDLLPGVLRSARPFIAARLPRFQNHSFYWTCIWLPVMYLPFGLSVLLPLAAINMHRERLNVVRDMSLDDSKIWGLKIGLSLAILPALWLFYCKDNSAIYPVELMPKRKCYSFFRLPLIGLLGCLELAIACLGNAYATVTLKHLHSLELPRSDSTANPDLYGEAHISAISWSVLVASLATRKIWPASYLNGLIPAQVGFLRSAFRGKTSIAALLFGLIPIVIFAKTLARYPQTLAPWSSADCESPALECGSTPSIKRSPQPRMIL